MKKSIRTTIVFAIALLLFQTSFAQETKQKKEFLYSNRISILAGLIQPIVLKGPNFEINYFTKKLSFDYSNGFNLDMAGSTITGDAKTQKLVYHLPYTLGVGVGYRFTSFFDVRVEPKVHSWEVYYDGETQNKTNLIKAYKTYTLGLGAYYRYFPFKKKESWLQGITTSSSFRWWPNVGSSLTDNQFTYLSKLTNKNETLKASNIGMGGSAFFVNVAIGYTFGGK